MNLGDRKSAHSNSVQWGFAPIPKIILQSKEGKMRKRNIRIQVRLNDIEYAKLLDDIAVSKANIQAPYRP